MKLRRFEFVDPNAGVKGSNKFWQVETRGNIYIANYGVRGTNGSFQPKPCASPLAADAMAQKKIQEKLREGYVEVTPEQEWLEAPGMERPTPGVEKCLFPGCVWTTEGKTEDEIRQHLMTAHNTRVPSTKGTAAAEKAWETIRKGGLPKCTYPGCKYKAKGEDADEKLQKHMQDVHGIDAMTVARALTGGRRVVIRPDEEE